MVTSLPVSSQAEVRGATRPYPTAGERPTLGDISAEGARPTSYGGDHEL